MKRVAERIRLSATDLANHLACPHLTALELAVARQQMEPPGHGAWMPVSLQQRGVAHERGFVEYLRAQGRQLVDLRASRLDAEGFGRTREAMQLGADVLVQAPLGDDGWAGRADVLQRVARPSGLGAWSYEPLDTKLARDTRGSAILQLCAYAEMLAAMQGTRPEWLHVVAPGDPFTDHVYRLDDFFAYYAHVKRRLQAFLADGEVQTYPEPVPHCEICRWQTVCLRRRRRDDHLSFVANIRALQIAELATWDITTLAALGSATMSFATKPKRVSIESLTKVQGQARVQLEARTECRLVHEVLPLVPGEGLFRLPAPSPGDIFFDLEGDAFAGETGQEYLFGYAYLDDEGTWRYQARWGLDAGREKQAFEAFVDFVMMRLERFPDLHVYHYAAYEASALRRLMGRHAVCEDEVDRLLRGRVFVDLYAVVRQAVRASVERYSIKDLEQFYGFTRSVPLVEVGPHLRAIELQLELGDRTEPSEEALALVEGYNRDDCLSAHGLRDWLEALRAGWEANGVALPRPVVTSAEPTEELGERELQVRALMARLLEGVPADVEQRTSDQQARWLLAQLLEFHRREDKAVWWEFFRLAEMPAEDMFDERAALGGLIFTARLGGTKKCPIDRYQFPPQELTRPQGDVYAGLDLKQDKIGEVVAVDLDARTLDIKKTTVAADRHPSTVFFHQRFNPKVLQEALLALGTAVADGGPVDAGSYGALGALLLNTAPDFQAGTAWSLPDESATERARRLAVALRNSVLPVQGPPGSGKTHTGAQMACALVRAGRKVGITGTSHRVIRHLLETILEVAAAEQLSIRCIQKVSDDDEDQAEEAIKLTTNNAEVLSALHQGEAQVAAGTAWLWARPEFREAVDVLIVDEAGQMSLANAFAAGQAARSLVLLGDPQQLEQPLQGSHPIGTDASVLQHVLGPHQTLPPDRGLFLAETWRLAPALCAFTSELFYEGRLRSKPGLERQRLDGPEHPTGAGLWFLPVEHVGNQNCSLEEAVAVRDLVLRLVSGAYTWIDERGIVRPIGYEQVLIVAPYNAQVYAIQERLPAARVGTVDRFQGQEAPVVIYSMATSSPEEAPRGMEFLYSLNRLNVATSRARCIAVLVASPKLFEPDCQTPRQMHLANAFCRYLELSTRLRAR